MENVFQRYLAENFSMILKELLRRTHVEKALCGVLFNKIAGMNSRPAASVKKSLRQGGLPVNILELSELLQEGLA